LALKELGFGEECLGYYGKTSKYSKNKLIREHSLYNKLKHSNGRVDAPLKTQAFEFFREKFKLRSWIESQDGYYTFYNYVILNRLETVPSKFYTKSNINTFKTYEDAEDACLNKLIAIAHAQKSNTKI
jgi:hypothetical protein